MKCKICNKEAKEIGQAPLDDSWVKCLSCFKKEKGYKESEPAPNFNVGNIEGGTRNKHRGTRTNTMDETERIYIKNFTGKKRDELIDKHRKQATKDRKQLGI